MRLPDNLTLPFAALVLLSGCAGGAYAASSRPDPIATTGPAADYPVVIGAPFVIEGVTHTPSDALNSDAVGYASAGEAGGQSISIAHKTLPLPSYAEVTSLDTGKTILVRVERRGPMTNERLVELSPGAAAQLGINGTSKAPIRIRRVNPPEQERAMLRSSGRAPDRMDTPQSLLTVLKRKLDPALVPVVVPATVPSVTPAPVAPVVAATPVVSNPARKPAVRRPVATKPVATPVAQPPATAPVVTDPNSTPVVQAIPGQTWPNTAPDSASSAVVQPLPAQSQAKPVDKPAIRNGRGLLVQVGAFANQANASAVAAKLGASLRTSSSLSRVVMGPFASQAEAQAALAKARAAGYSDARIQSAR